ncbi:magnesium transporter [Nematocida displodere]|uniref:Magnesium transporter n=1 Tax=Nematocida displodere TaxID=1805483 RepID=A0A177ED03_9MICR|nr:magnesium transporter [Nematocida displodere]
MHSNENYRGALAEIITIYRKMKKGRDTHQIYKSRKGEEIDETSHYVSETLDTIPRIRRSEKEELQYQMIFNFCALNMLNPSGNKYLFYSKDSGLLQSEMLDNLSANLSEIFKTSFFWLNTFNPTDADLQAIGLMFNIHDLTLLDIKERNTDEKIEVFKHYTFISMKLLVEPSSEAATEDMDFNILVFKDFILTFHDKPWVSVQDTFNFIELLSKHTPLTPSWVLYSIVIEFLQDIKYLADNCNAETMKIQDQSKNFGGSQMANLLKQNFAVSCQVNTLQMATRSKVDILSLLKNRCRKRIVPLVQKYLSESTDDLKDVSKRLTESHRVLERAQDTYLALVNVAQTQEGNELNKTMGFMSLVALIISPCQILSGLWGMNVRVPYQESKSLVPFYCIIVCSLLLIVVFFYRPLWNMMRRTRGKR